MPPLISARAVGYLALAAICCTGIVSCNMNSGLSDTAAKAVSENCSKTGQVVYIRITKSEILAECRKP
jgi:hypothetical protein